nr:unnamed protein product [Callosobruchus analis]
MEEENETEITYTHTASDSVISPGIQTMDGLHTHVAFDNFDRFVDTCGGKDTLHNTGHNLPNKISGDQRGRTIMDHSAKHEQDPVPRQTIDNNVNPFDVILDGKEMSNICTGKAASPLVAEFLTNSRYLGRAQKESFIASCEENPKKFNESVKCNKILNFAHEC